ncbi:MAG: antitoxin HicB [Candidatus Liptonbacteria bacterium CG11_big_fil_rev_8_21_14_0_20_35_14]|uniref:Antitoxin HicB n=1 Tax=Candidatus Liptonbacteria bacterium CG11_big_fil_rev_8_21_14_0_20_35_14 TaxID=1974634 RepID=A0A2H0N7T6_9BACT|nr:MAG: antitoxin HicB [Candidatus Liptonbacteria bacterium CG11_big_fil_rev_8_21_14_0_20_35_14]
MKSLIRFNVILKPEPEGGFTVLVPSLPGCITYGKDLEEAKKMSKEAILAYIQSIKKRGDNIPSDDSESFISSVEMTEINV